MSFLLIIILYFDIAASTELYEPLYRPIWRYDDETTWPGTYCRRGGKRQSPIDITASETIKDFTKQFIKYGPLKFLGYDQVLMNGINNGRTIQFSTEVLESMEPTLTGGPLNYTYRLQHILFHRISEHSVDGIKYPMEIHLVHIRSDLSVKEALAKKDGLAIVAVFCTVHEELKENQRETSEEIIQYVQLINTGGRISGMLLNVTKLFSEDTESYYTYAGSLTLPECNEAVIWIIFDKPIYVSDALYQIFSKMGTGHNFRSLQARQQRVFRPPSGFITTPHLVKTFGEAYRLVAQFFKNVTNVMVKGLKSP